MLLKEKVSKILPTSAKLYIKQNYFIQKYVVRKYKSNLTQKDIQFWNKNGYLILPKFFDSNRLTKVNDLIDYIWLNRNKIPNNPLVADIFIGTKREKRVFLKNAPNEARKYPYKLNDLFLESEEVRNLILDLELCKILYDLLEGEPMVCNSLSFEHGSQQKFHFDTFYMPPLVPNKMLATWIALEDCSLDAGPLAYYPGSHKIKPYLFSHGHVSAIREEMPLWETYIQRELEKYQLKPQKFAAKAGDVFIWHAQLLHGGSEIKDMSLTRKSIVTHYLRTNEHPGDYISLGKYRNYMNRGHQNPPSR